MFQNIRIINRLLVIRPNLSSYINNSTRQFNLNQCKCMTIVKKIKEDELTSNINNTDKISKIDTETEKEFLLRLKNDPDLFGTPPKEATIDADDIKEEKFLEEKPLGSQKLRTKQYADIIKSLIRKHKIKEALDVLEIRMLKEDRVKPESYIYSLLLGACGRVGYTKKAFSLYNKMKQRGVKVHAGAYTALFNACANSPWPETDGLSRAKHLYNIMIEKMYEPNEMNYHAMIKAFGRCGDLPMAFQIADEMISKGFKIKDDTINFLLQAAITDKNAGFRHALLIWRKVIDKNIKPSVFTFNLLLRTIRDCDIGDVEVTKDVLGKILKNVPEITSNEQNTLKITSGEDGNLIESSSENDEKSDVILSPCNGKNDSEISSIVKNTWTPNLMAKKPHLGNILSLSEIKKPEDRLLLVGGCKGFLENMAQHECTPDIKTFTLLLDCIPNNLQSEKELSNRMKKLEVTPDLDFFNMLIKKRSMRFDYAKAKEVLLEMERYNYKPNILTYGILALSCKTKNEAVELISEMKSQSYTLNAQILGAMLHQACANYNFSYVLEVMEICKSDEIKPNKKFMERLESFKKETKHISNDKDHHLYHNKKFQLGYRAFKMRYGIWKDEIEVDETENEHPWTQYRQRNETDGSKYRDKSVRFKPIRQSKFKVKISTKVRY